LIGRSIIVKSIVLDNGNIIKYVDDIETYKPQLIGKNSMYELAGSYNPLDPYLTLKKFEYIERDVTDYNELRTKHQEYWEFQCQFFVFTKHIITMEG